MLTREQAITVPYGTVLYHIRFRNRDGSAARVRVSGRCKTWKRRPEDFRLLVRHGLFDCFYLTPDNASSFTLSDPCASGVDGN